MRSIKENMMLKNQARAWFLHFKAVFSVFFVCSEGWCLKNRDQRFLMGVFLGFSLFFEKLDA